MTQEHGVVGSRQHPVRATVGDLELGDPDHGAIALVNPALRADDRAAGGDRAQTAVLVDDVLTQLKLTGNGMSTTVAGSVPLGPLKWSLIRIIALPWSWPE